jgi:hypothetical protein
MVKIIAPNKNYNGISAGVRFMNGIGETSDARLLGWFKEKGYTVVEETPVKDDKPKDEVKDEEVSEKAEEIIEPETPKKKNTRKKAE